MNVKQLVLPFTFALFIGFPSLSSFAQEKREPIVCEGDVVEYLTEEKKVVGRGNVVITYRDMRLTCDEATVYLDTEEAIATGNVTLYEGESVFQAERVRYNFETEKGTLIEGEAKVEGELATKFWYGKAKEAEKVRAKEYHLHDGYITTCDLDPPHYRIQSKKIKVYLDDKVTATHVLFFAGNYPLFYLPYYSHSLKDNLIRVTLIPGKKKEWGLFTLSKWRYYFNEGSRGYINIDWRELRGWAEGIDYNYRTGEFGEGSLRTYRIVDLDRQKEPAEGRRKRIRYRGKLRHRWQINEDTLLVAEYHRLKDKSVIKDFFFEEEYKNEPQPESFVSVTGSRPGYSLKLELRKRMNRFFSVVEKLPELSLDIPKLRVAKTKFYLQNQTNLANLNNKIVSQVGTAADDISLTEDRDVVRLDTYNELSYATKLFGWLEANPYIGWRQTWYSKDSNGDPNLLRGIYYDGLDLSTQFSRIFRFKGSPFGIEINNLRHLIEPSVSYYYIRDPTVETGRIMQIDSIDEITRSTGVTLTLENKLQTKRSIGDQSYQAVDVADLTLSTTYYPAKEEPHKISNISGKLELRPYNWLTMEMDASYDSYRKKSFWEGFDDLNLDLIADGGDKWQLGLGWRYSKDSSAQLTTETSYRISPKWKVRTYHRHEFEGKELQEQEYGIARDLHCWVAELTYNVRDAETIWLVFRLKAFPEMPFEWSTTYHEPKIGSQGSGWKPTPRGRRLLGVGF